MSDDEKDKRDFMADMIMDAVKGFPMPDEEREELKLMLQGPNSDDPDSKSPCSKCLGVGSCNIAHIREPRKECNTFIEVGTLEIEFKDGSKKIL